MCLMETIKRASVFPFIRPLPMNAKLELDIVSLKGFNLKNTIS